MDRRVEKLELIIAGNSHIPRDVEFKKFSSKIFQYILNNGLDDYISFEVGDPPLLMSISGNLNDENPDHFDTSRPIGAYLILEKEMRLKLSKTKALVTLQTQTLELPGLKSESQSCMNALEVYVTLGSFMLDRNEPISQNLGEKMALSGKRMKCSFCHIILSTSLIPLIILYTHVIFSFDWLSINGLVTLA